MIYSTEIFDGGAKKFVTAHYSLYIPKGIAHIKGIFIHQHGCTMEGTVRLLPQICNIRFLLKSGDWTYLSRI